MPFTPLGFNVRLSDLVFHEIDPASGYSREVINVTPPAAGAALKLGQVVFRVKGTTGAFAAVAAGADVAATNEYAVVFGDQFGFNPSFVPLAITAGTFNSVAFIRGSVQLKEYYIKPLVSALNAAQWETLKTLLKAQGVIIETTV